MSPVEACRRRDAALVAALRPRLHSFTDAGRMGKRLLPRVVDSYIAVLDLLLQPRNAQQPDQEQDRFDYQAGTNTGDADSSSSLSILYDQYDAVLLTRFDVKYAAPITRTRGIHWHRRGGSSTSSSHLHHRYGQHNHTDNKRSTPFEASNCPHGRSSYQQRHPHQRRGNHLLRGSTHRSSTHHSSGTGHRSLFSEEFPGVISKFGEEWRKSTNGLPPVEDHSNNDDYFSAAMSRVIDPRATSSSSSSTTEPYPPAGDAATEQTSPYSEVSWMSSSSTTLSSLLSLAGLYLFKNAPF